jgi:four helix bundle protein
VQDFCNLKIWQKAHALTLAVYQATATFPGEERFGLTIQLRRTAASVPISIADDCGRGTDAEFRKCLSLAMGAAKQLEYQALLAHDLGYLPAPVHTRLGADAVEVQRMLAGLMHTLQD